MTAAGRLLDLAPGAGFRIDGVDWVVDEVQPQHGRVVLVSTEGRTQDRSVSWLMHHRPEPLAQPMESSGGDGRRAQPRTLADLTPLQLRRARLRAEHVREAVTGFRDGHPARARPGEPRAEYDPARTTLMQRRKTKAQELAGLDPLEAELLGLQRMSERTLIRLSAPHVDELVLACADGRWTRRRTGRVVRPEIREAVLAVRQESVRRSRISMRGKHRLLHQYMAERFPGFPTKDVPSCDTLARIWGEWFGPGGARQRYLRTGEMLDDSGPRVVVHRPGQVVALDSTPLPVKLRESVFGEPVSVMLTLALDVYTHSCCAFRLTMVSDTSVDVAMLLRDVMMPLPMREGWGEEMEWPYPGVPAGIVADFAGHKVAGLPFFAPETVTTDHGAPCKNHQIVQAQDEIGCNILPARTLRATDKCAVERAFGSLKSMLLEHLLGFTGTDVADRGADPEADAVLTIGQMEHTVATWIVKIWQNHALGEYAPSWEPGGHHSPNSLFAAAMHQGGWAMQIPTPELYYRLLRKHHVMIHPRRGVKILGLYYYDPVLDEPCFRGPSARGGRHGGRWVVRSDRRDRRTVFLQDPDDHETWHVLRWTGLPPRGEVPAFSDQTVEALMADIRLRKLKVLSDTELLPSLLQILRSAAPVDQWPTQMTRKQKVSRSRLASQGRAAESDRPSPTDPAPGATASYVGAGEPAGPSWPQEARTVQAAVDADLRRRREDLDGPPQAPQLLDDALRQRSLFLLPDLDDDEPEDDA
ncbi:transposase [Streptomyces anulatus]|uniref:transposase n=1 Tax=Streptomyces TaxID=1883 RepID=UPI000BFE7E29|nr:MULTISPECIES: transposase [Streptomyces]MCX4502199.1 transposase [Streptomyces anulatus]WTC75299.1 transposase [Streptomyces anulatus]WUD87314.1 transposase [Streptomyces anulatus]